MTDEEKREMAAVDERARALLERTEALSPQALNRLHGTLRSLRHIESERKATLRRGMPWIPSLGLPTCASETLIFASAITSGCAAPGGADILDIALDGKTATIESIERDFEDRVHVAVVVDDDPGKEFGLNRMPGHRFFFSPEEEICARMRARAGHERPIAGIGNIFFGDDGFGSKSHNV